jgi:putative DNA primase/helicase
LFVASTRDEKWTDYNDLHAAHGLEAVQMQLDIARMVGEIAAEAGEASSSSSAATPPPSSGGGGGGEDGPPPWLDEAPPPDPEPRKRSKNSPEPAGGDDDWLPPGEFLHFRKGAIVGDLHNTHAFLAHHPAWAGVLAYDLFGEQVVKLEAPPFEGGAVGEWTDLDDYRALLWLSRHMAEPPDKTIRQAVVLVAHRHEFNKVRDYLEACERAWDGTSRLDSWLVEYFGVTKDATHEDLPPNDRARVLEYVKLAGRKWLVAGAARALSPGCRADNMLILEGAQGMQKSSALRTMFGEWFTDQRLDFSNKDTLLILQGRWGVEMPELDGMNKADTSETKRFLTQPEDLFRPPYGQKLVKAPRRCIFAGTVNHEQYLKDDTGNRRFWPVRCNAVDLEALARDRDQLWGEAVRLYRDRVPHWVTVEERPLFEEQQDLRFQIDAWEAPIRAYLDGDDSSPSASRKDRCTTAQLMGGALGLDKARWDRQAMIRVGSILRRLGWPRRREATGARGWYYVRPDVPGASSSSQAPADKGGDGEPF